MKGKLGILIYVASGILIGLLVGFQASIAGENACPHSLFLGVHHVGLYTGPKTDALTLSKWYGKYFGFKFIETPMSYFATQQGLEIMKRESQVKGHVGIQVCDIEAARKDLESRGIELEPTVDVGPALAAYIKGTDPADYKVHLFYKKQERGGKAAAVLYNNFGKKQIAFCEP
jgi:hypothetical protein